MFRALPLVTVAAAHYGAPPCLADEMMGSLPDGKVMCAPQCAALTHKCAIDVPAGVSATPTCMFKGSDKKNYCGTLCYYDKQCDVANGAVCDIVGKNVGTCAYPAPANGGGMEMTVGEAPFGRAPQLAV